MAGINGNSGLWDFTYIPYVYKYGSIVLINNVDMEQIQPLKLDSGIQENLGKFLLSV